MFNKKMKQKKIGKNSKKIISYYDDFRTMVKA